MNRTTLGLVIALSAAIGFFLGAALPLAILTILDGQVSVGHIPGSHGQIYLPESHAEEPRLTHMQEMRQQVTSECSARLAESQGLPTMAASALVEARWQTLDFLVRQALETAEGNDMPPEARSDLHAMFARACTQAMEALYFGVQPREGVHWQPNEAPHEIRLVGPRQPPAP